MRGPILTLFLALAAPFAAGAASAPNGQISFWSDRANGRAQVFVMNADGTHQHRLTNLFSAKRGDFSPNGRKLVFDGRGYETLFDFDIFVMNADGSDVRRLTRGPERDTQASWSPDGRTRRRSPPVRPRWRRGLGMGGGSCSRAIATAIPRCTSSASTEPGSAGSHISVATTTRRTSLPTAARSCSRAIAAASCRSTS